MLRERERSTIAQSESGAVGLTFGQDNLRVIEKPHDPFPWSDLFLEGRIRASWFVYVLQKLHSKALA